MAGWVKVGCREGRAVLWIGCTPRRSPFRLYTRNQSFSKRLLGRPFRRLVMKAFCTVALVSLALIGSMGSSFSQPYGYRDRDDGYRNRDYGYRDRDYARRHRQSRFD